MSRSLSRAIMAIAALLPLHFSACGGDAPTEADPGTDAVQASVSISPQEVTLNAVEATHDFSAEVTGGDDGVVWTSTEPEIASVDDGGTATAHADGITEIVASISSDADTATLTVAIEVTELDLTPQLDTIAAGGGSVQLNVELRDANGHSVEDAEVEWASLDEAVATVDAEGRVTGHDVGETDVHASIDDAADTARIVVEDPPGNDAPTATIESPEDGATHREDEVIVFEGSGSDIEDGVLTGASLEWSSSVDGVFGTGDRVETEALSTGSHTITLTAIDGEGAEGTDEIALTVESIQINLAVKRLDVDGRGVLSSETLELGGMVINTGIHAAGPFEWSLRVDGTVESSGSLPGVAGGDSVAIPTRTGIGPYASGEHEVVLELDTGAEIEETNEVDNSLADRFQSYDAGTYDIELDYLTSISSSQRAVFEQAAARWSDIVTADLPDITFSSPQSLETCAEGAGDRSESIDDLLIFVRIDSIDGEGSVLGRAGPCFVRLTSDDRIRTSVVGGMVFDEADLDAMEVDGTLEAVILHEMGHVLGIGTLWGAGAHDLIAGSGTSDPVYTGTGGRLGFFEIGGEQYAGTPVPAANTGGTGTQEAHWRESVFVNELMTGFINFGDNPLSVMSVRGLRDQYYPVDASQADFYQLPTGAQLRAGPGEGVDLRDDVRRGPVYGIQPHGQMRLLGGTPW